MRYPVILVLSLSLVSPLSTFAKGGGHSAGHSHSTGHHSGKSTPKGNKR